MGDQFSVKLPSKAADVVIVIESRPKNQQLYDKLVKTLIPELTTELHNKGVRWVTKELIELDLNHLTLGISNTTYWLGEEITSGLATWQLTEN